MVVFGKFWGSRDPYLKKLDPSLQKYIDQLEDKDGADTPNAATQPSKVAPTTKGMAAPI
ncbi:MAG: hypothetical protein KC776_22630 [Myxococcales bacterium]|nr:hypothetical protein [Myxococcales bacterium]MCB9581453.1 hypothetical protein [Polyangiaceae bacterium]